MIQISQYLFINHTFLFLSMEYTIFAFFFAREGFICRDRTLFNIYRTVFFEENYTEISVSEKNVFFLKFYFLWSRNYAHNKRLILTRNPTVKINKRLANIFSSTWLKIFDFCNNFLFNFFSNNMKLMVLDSDHKNFFYFLNHQFNIEDIVENIDYFFPNPKNFSRWNWYIYFEIFCEYHNISAFFVSDTVLINKNITRISSLGIPIVAFLVHRQDNIVDYSFFFRVKGNEYYYLLASMFLNYTFFLSLNHRFSCFKFLYVKQVGYLVNHISHDHFFEDYRLVNPYTE